MRQHAVSRPCRATRMRGAPVSIVLTCLECGAQHRPENSTATMNQRLTAPCPGRCGRPTNHIAGLPPEHRHLTSLSRPATPTQGDYDRLGRFLPEPPPRKKPRRK